jgi:hypothetical protein
MASMEGVVEGNEFSTAGDPITPLEDGRVLRSQALLQAAHGTSGTTELEEEPKSLRPVSCSEPSLEVPTHTPEVDMSRSDEAAG